MTEYYKILRIADAIDNISNGQIACEATAHPIIGVRAWGGKDHAGNVTRFLALNKPGQLSTLNLSGPTTSGNTGILVHDAAGDVSGGKMTIDEFNTYLSDGPIGVYDAGDGIDITDFVVSATPYTGSTGIDITGFAVSLDHLGLEDLTAPASDRIYFYDQSAGKSEWLTLGAGVTISGTELVATGTLTDVFIHRDGSYAFTGNQSMGTHNLTNIGTLSGATTLGFSNSYFAASDWTGDMPLSSSSDEINTLLGFAGGEVSVFGALNLGITAITDDNGVTQVKGAPLAIYAGNSILISKIQGQAGFENGFKFDYNPEGAHIAPVSINTAIGTPTGSLSGILTINDGSVYHVDETTGSPAIIVNIGWGDITSFNRIVLRLWYHGVAPLHTISVQLQNFATPGYDEFASLSLTAGYQVLSFEVPNPSDYINSGAVTLRLYHEASGSTAHDLDIDYASMIVGTGGGVVSMQGAYDGGKTITMSSGNAGPVVINSGTEASPCLSLAQTQASFSSYVASIANAATPGTSNTMQFSGAAGDGSTAESLGHLLRVVSGSLSLFHDEGSGDTYTRSLVSIGYDAIESNPAGQSFWLEASNRADNSRYARIFGASGLYGSYNPYLKIESSGYVSLVGSLISLSCTGELDITCSSVDLNDAPVIEATVISYGQFEALTAASGVITVDWTAKQFNKSSVLANITNVKMTPPTGSCGCHLKITNTDSVSHTITGFTKADGTTPCVTWKGDVDPDAGAIHVAAGETATFDFVYDAAADNYEGWVSLDA